MTEASQTILIVNDNRDHLDLMTVLLNKAGYRTMTADEGGGGVELALAERPDLIISDVNMRGLDGIELCRRLRAEAATRLTPIMLVSAERVGSANAAAGLRAGADDYLEAPYDPVRLIAKAARLLERKQGEEALRASEARYRVLFENNPLSMWVYDAESLSFLDVNEAAVRQYGYSRAEFLGMTLKEIRPPEETPAFLDVLEGRGPHTSGVWRHRKKDGTVFEAETVSHEIIFGGRPALLALSTDVTERRRAEAAIRFQAHLLDRVEQAVIATDLSGTIIYWNRFAERLYGHTAAQALGRNIIDVTPADASREQAGEILSRLKAGQSWSGELLVRRSDGTTFPALITDSPIHDDAGKLIGVVGVSVDITERKKEEEQLARSNEQLRALSVRVQSAREEESIRIAREIHDELGGALTGLKMDLSWIGRRLSEQTREAVQQKLQSTLELVDDTVHKVRNISTELRPSVLDDLGLAAAIEWQAREFEKRTEIECRIVSLQEDSTLSPEKSTALFRIFQEVLTNVIRHSGASRVEVCMEEHGGSLILQVSDNGRGIKESEVAEAKSLGLLGMRERALVFGGRIEVVGVEGRGTTVTVRIPLA
jgi:PAS domain S-box-containing protein